MSKRTPWGEAQDSTEKAPGITFHETAGHGGFELSPERMREFRSKLPSFMTFAGDPWFEEDCDACAIVIAFPDVFDEPGIYNCIRSVRSMAATPAYKAGWPDVERYINHNMRLLEIEERQRKLTTGMWERGSLSGGGLKPEYNGHWVVGLQRENTHVFVLMPSYPTKQWYTEQEISTFEPYNREKHDR